MGLSWIILAHIRFCGFATQSVVQDASMSLSPMRLSEVQNLWICILRRSQMAYTSQFEKHRIDNWVSTLAAHSSYQKTF